MWSSNLITSSMRVPLVCWLVIRICLPRLSWVVVFVDFYRGMVSLPDVKAVVFADDMCRRMFSAIMMGFSNLWCFRGLSDAWIVYVPCVFSLLNVCSP